MFGASRLALFAANPAADTGVSGGYSYFMGGYADSRIATVYKYTIGTDAVTTATALSAARDQASGFANGTTGHVCGGSTGSSITTHEIYTLSTESKAGGTALSSARRDTHAGSSTSTLGYIFGGYNASALNTIAKYQYSDDTWPTFSTSLGWTTVWTSTASHNNSTTAVILGGYSGSTPNTEYKLFTFSTETPGSNSSLPAAQGQVSMTGNQSKAIALSGFGPGTFVTMTNAVRYYDFAAGTWTSATNLGYTIRFGEGAGDDFKGIFAGGSAGSFTLSTAHTKYQYSDDTMTTATQIYSTAADSPAAFHSLQAS